jgi:endonuclease YncB( thermonuclease family)
MVNRYLVAWIAFLVVVVSPALLRADFLAKVVAVHEGDRLTIYHAGQKETIYLKDVDCPEITQPYGKQAKIATAAYVGNRDIVIRELKRGRNGRTSAEVVLQDGRSIAQELLKEGLAWVRPDTSEGRGLAEFEQLARAAGKGLWADPSPVPPWKWKATRKISRRKFSN